MIGAGEYLSGPSAPTPSHSDQTGSRPAPISSAGLTGLPTARHGPHSPKLQPPVVVTVIPNSQMEKLESGRC